MKILFTTIVLLLLVSLNIYGKEDVVFFTVGEWVPFVSEKNKNGRIAQKIVSESMALEGITVKYRYVPWKRAFIEAQRVNSDGTFPWYVKEDRLLKFHYSKRSIISTKTVFFHLKTLNFQWDTFSDLNKYKVGGMLSFKTGQLLMKKGVKVELVPTILQNFKKMLKGRIDIAPSSKLVGLHILKNTFKPEIAKLFTYSEKEIFVESEKTYLLVSKKHPRGKELVDKLDRGILKLKASGRYQEILDEVIAQ